jgi:4-hydroxybenzoate polyprenyltransferase
MPLAACSLTTGLSHHHRSYFPMSLYLTQVLSGSMKSIKDFFELIKFEHTIFALPFAYLGMLIAAGGVPEWHLVFWITIAMAAARTLAMGINRIVDRWIDSRNPRTSNRPLVTGRISLRTAWIGTVIASLIFILAAWTLGPWTLYLSPIALVFLIGYSFTKRFTWSSHFILGLTDGLAPIGAWLAIRQSLLTPPDFPAWILLLIVTTWIGGFDLIYACQDIQYDLQDNLQSIPMKFGVSFTLRLSTICHLLTLILLATLGIMLSLNWPYWIDLLLSAAFDLGAHVGKT